MWTLYRKTLSPHIYHYAWAEDGEVKHNRVSFPFGFQWCVPVSYPSLKSRDGWRKVNTKMTQEQLSKGWLC